MIELLWIAHIISESAIHAYIIKKLKKPINHKLAALIRIAYGGLFIFAFIGMGYIWYWSIAFVFVSHILIFPEALNIFRGKRIGYLDSDDVYDEAEDSGYDLLISKHIGETVWLVIRCILALFFFAAFFYNIPFSELMK